MRWLRTLLLDVKDAADATTRLSALRAIQAAPVDECAEDTAKRGHRWIHDAADRAKTGNADILGLVLKRERERQNQPRNVRRFIRTVNS
jgi:hypothetical protein